MPCPERPMSITPEEAQETNNVVAQFYLDFLVCDLPRHYYYYAACT